MSSESHKVHFIGVGGIGISALARHYLHEGWQVSGSELSQSDNARKLEAEGVAVTYEQSPDNIKGGEQVPDLVVYTDGVTKETAGWGELEAARAAGIETISYFEALGRVANDYYLIAVAGTHGKTTTTAMLADILEEASFDPTVVVGSLRTKTGTNYRPGHSKYFVVEADEYMRHFLELEPDILIINNLDYDHPDYFADLEDVQDAFAAMVAKVPEEGFIIANTKDPHVASVLDGAAATVVNYGDCLNIERRMNVPGLHNRQNAAAAEAAALALAIEQRFIDDALTNFAGTARRFEYKGEVNGVPVYDDYAHNPQKVAAAIAGARELFPDRELIVAFQPHTYSRTKELFAEFVAALSKADRVYLLPIFAARETDDGSVSSNQLQVAVAEQGTASELFYTHEALALAIKEQANAEQVIVCVGAGSITKVATLLTG